MQTYTKYFFDNIIIDNYSRINNEVLFQKDIIM